jgi:hypothetical protein
MVSSSEMIYFGETCWFEGGESPAAFWQEESFFFSLLMESESVDLQLHVKASNEFLWNLKMKKSGFVMIAFDHNDDIFCLNSSHALVLL